MKYEIRIEGKSATLSISGGRFAYCRDGGDCIESNYSAMPAGEGAWSILSGDRSYAVTLLSENQVSVNGRVFQVEALDPRGPRARRAAMEISGPLAVTTPMPGRVVRVLVEPGQEVAAGQGLIVVEAMKMQNEIKSPRAGRVTSVKALADATVSAGDVLLVIE